MLIRLLPFRYAHDLETLEIVDDVTAMAQTLSTFIICIVRGVVTWQQSLMGWQSESPPINRIEGTERKLMAKNLAHLGYKLIRLELLMLEIFPW